MLMTAQTIHSKYLKGEARAIRVECEIHAKVA